jgi:carbon monoxide dehydrogenase subunit G
VQLDHSFTVPVSIDEAWKVLLDIERVGPCMPGASIDSVNGDEFTGTVKVKLGPINLTYKGQASFVEKDEAARRAVINARGKDARGNGTASAVVTATLSEDAGSTKVNVRTDLDITGKPAQFGRGVMVDVGNKLIGQFAECLATTLGGSGGAADPPTSSQETSDPPKVNPGPSDPPTTNPTAGEAEAAAGQPEKRARPKPARPAAPADAPQASAAEEQAVQQETTTPSYSVPGGVSSESMSAVNDHHGSSPGSPRDVEPINLLQSAGPAVAKRLAPVAVGVVIVLLALARRRRANRS